MKKKYLYFLIFIITIVVTGCSDDDKDIEVEQSNAHFLQETVSVSPLGGNVSVFVGWSNTEWEIQVENDNGIIDDISPKTGGKINGKGNTLVRFTCNANKTDKDKKQDVFIVNKKNGERSKLVIEQPLENGMSGGYHVSNSGSDDSDGGRITPFKTIAKAASVAQPGDTIWVKEGTYSEHSIKPAMSGIDGAMIVFKPADGARTVTIKHPATEFTGAGMTSTPVFDLTDRNYIRIEGFDFKDFQYDQASVFIVRGERNVVMNNRFENLGNNQVMDGSATCVVYVRDGHFNIIRNNYFNNIFGDGVGIKGGSESSPSTNNLISENTFLNFKGKPRGWAPTGSFSSNMNAELQSYGDNIFAFNYATRGKMHIWFDRNGSGNIVLRNVAHDQESLFFNESRCVRNLAQENIAYNMSAPAFETAKYETADTEDARWINNVVYNCHRGFHVHKSHRDEFRNNIAFNNRETNLLFTALALSNGPHIFKNNLWYSASKPKSIKFQNVDVEVPAFQAAIGEINGLSVDPKFVSTTPGAEDFRLQETSPAKGAGDTGIDLGAYAVYEKTVVGYDDKLEIAGGIQADFATTLSSVTRGGTLYLIVNLNKQADQPVSVEIAPVAGDARQGVDFSLDSQVINFGAGERSKNISIPFQGTAEHDQLITFLLRNPVNAQIGPKNIHVVRVKKN